MMNAECRWLTFLGRVLEEVLEGVPGVVGGDEGLADEEAGEARGGGADGVDVGAGLHAGEADEGGRLGEQQSEPLTW